MSEAAWVNMVDAMCVVDGPFMDDLAQSVDNAGEHRGARRWLLSQAVGHFKVGPVQAYDRALEDWLALDRAWPIMRKAAEPFGLGAYLPSLARFVADRLPVFWATRPVVRHGGVTRAVNLADRSDTLAAMFSAGVKATGSADPYALRRASKEWLYLALPDQAELREMPWRLLASVAR
jgi:hypothetical protein